MVAIDFEIAPRTKAEYAEITTGEEPEPELFTLFCRMLRTLCLSWSKTVYCFVHWMVEFNNNNNNNKIPSLMEKIINVNNVWYLYGWIRSEK